MFTCSLHASCQCQQDVTLWAYKIHVCHLERSYLLLLCGIGYTVVKWSYCELKRDILLEHLQQYYFVTYKC